MSEPYNRESYCAWCGQREYSDDHQDFECTVRPKAWCDCCGHTYAECEPGIAVVAAHIQDCPLVAADVRARVLAKAEAIR